MITNKKSILIILLITIIGLGACKKAEYNIGDIITPTGLTLTTVIQGVDAANPFGNGTGKVDITVKAANALTYKIDFGDGTAAQMVPSGVIQYRYGNPGIASAPSNANPSASSCLMRFDSSRGSMTPSSS